jgi:hypothetical protein
MKNGDFGEKIEAVALEWARRAAKSAPLVPRMQLHRFVGEAFELALFVEEFWEPRAELEAPGLVTVASSAFTRNSANEIRELALAVLHWEGKSKTAYVRRADAPVARGRVVLSELLSSLAFLLEAEPSSRGAAALRKVRESLEPGSHDGLALALESVARLAEQHRRALVKLPGLDASLLDEAPSLAQALRKHSATALTREDARSSFRNTRLRVSRLLHDRVTAARAAIRFAFRAHPDLVALATSEYKRTSRATQRQELRSRTAEAGARG